MPSRSQFYITFKAATHLDNKHTVFGKLVGGEDVLNTLEKLPLKVGTERPAKPVRITEVIMYANYFTVQPSILISLRLDIKIHLTSTRHGLQENLLGVQKHRITPINPLRRLKGMTSTGLGSKLALGTRHLLEGPQVLGWVSI